MLRVLVAEDSPTARALLVEILSSDPEIEVIGAVSSGAEAIEMTQRLRPDLVTVDVQMPGVDGLQATREIMATVPTPIIIVSSTAPHDSALSLTAIEAGALMVVAKPEGPLAEGFAQQRDYLLRMVRAMADVRVVRRWRPQFSPAGPATLERTPVAEPRLVAVAASTGGPAALRQILRELPSDYAVPIAIVQHIAHGFAAGLVDWLNSGGGPHVELARSGERLRPGRAYVAPDDRHLGVTHSLIMRLSDAPPVGHFRPSATYLFRSAAALGAGVTAVVLTGMGDDGVAGLSDLHRAGGRVIGQDEASSVIYGMAQEALRAGLVDEILPLGRISGRLLELTRERSDA
jgi:two-component system chemotaxis response regulator CheB